MENKFLFVVILCSGASIKSAAPAVAVAPAPRTPPRIVRTVAALERKSDSAATVYKLVTNAPVQPANAHEFYAAANAAAGQASRAPLRRKHRLA